MFYTSGRCIFVGKPSDLLSDSIGTITTVLWRARNMQKCWYMSPMQILDIQPTKQFSEFCTIF